MHGVIENEKGDLKMTYKEFDKLVPGWATKVTPSTQAMEAFRNVPHFAAIYGETDKYFVAFAFGHVQTIAKSAQKG